MIRPLDGRRQSGVEERVSPSQWALRDAMARGAQELRCSCRPVWPVDRPCARPKATRGIVLAAHVGSAKRPHNQTNEVAGGSSSECARGPLRFAPAHPKSTARLRVARS
jgi:hypothetical protein